MILYMSSYRIGNKADYLKNWIMNNDNKIAVIPNALDYHDVSVRQNKIDEKLSDLVDVGFDYFVVDLRDYFNKPNKLMDVLGGSKAVYVLGGNTFVLRRAMYLSGFDKFVESKRKESNFLYAGFSAGICVLSDFMYGLDIEDDKNIDPYNCGFTLFEGLGLINYVPVPHYKSDYVDQLIIDKTIEYLNKNNYKYKTIKDGDVIICENVI